MSYQDQWTRFHDKPTNGIHPSSDNGWIYSAYAKYIMPESLDKEKLLRCYNDCVISLDPVMINRSPNQATPPFSKDEVIGCVSLGLLTDNQLKNSHYNFCNIRSDFNRKLTIKSLFTSIKTLFKIRKEHRNYMWENNLVETYPLSFKLPPEDIYYVKKFYNKNPGLFLTLAFYINAFFTIKYGDKSSRMMLWLKVKDLEIENTIIGRAVMKRHKQWIETYFGKDHILTKESR